MTPPKLLLRNMISGRKLGSLLIVIERYVTEQSIEGARTI